MISTSRSRWTTPRTILEPYAWGGIIALQESIDITHVEQSKTEKQILLSVVCLGERRRPVIFSSFEPVHIINTDDDAVPVFY